MSQWGLCLVNGALLTELAHESVKAWIVEDASLAEPTHELRNCRHVENTSLTEATHDLGGHGLWKVSHRLSQCMIQWALIIESVALTKPTHELVGC